MWFSNVSGSNNNNNNSPVRQSGARTTNETVHQHQPAAPAQQGAGENEVNLSKTQQAGTNNSHQSQKPILNQSDNGHAAGIPDHHHHHQHQHHHHHTSSKPEKVSFYFKTSIFTHRVTIERDKMDLGTIKELAVAFLNQLYFQNPSPANSYQGEYIRKHFTVGGGGGCDGTSVVVVTDDKNQSSSSSPLYERLVLRKYLISEESFVPFNSVSDIETDSYISIELSEKHLPSASSHHSQSSQSSCSNTSSHGRIKIAHEFKPESFYFITLCASCNNVIKGVYRQGFKCSFCSKNYCPKCKVKAEAEGESCLSAHQSTASQASQSTLPASGHSPDSNQQASSDGSGGSPDSPHAAHHGSGKGAETANMSKRKSASNLLHFNLANPFKSHHNQTQASSTTATSGNQQQATGSSTKSDEGKSKLRSSAGALDPILQQLCKNRGLEQQNRAAATASASKDSMDEATGCTSGNSLQVAQANLLSSSHQNLFATETGVGSNGDQSVGNTLSQSPVSSRKSQMNKLSNSARTSAHDLHSSSPAVARRSRENQVANHAFISMDWIQMSGERHCGVCNKLLQSQPPQQPQLAPSMCKNCKIQVHAQCQNLVLTDCLSRIAANSRAAADSSNAAVASQGQHKDMISPTTSSKDALKNTNSNVSRDNIRLHRLAPSVKHVKRPDLTKPIIEGWLKHTTLADEQARQHYWRLDETDITLYENDTSTRYFKAISVNKIKRVMSAHSLPKRVREDVLTGGQLIAQPVAGSGSSKARSANTSPTKSPELQAQMKAMFAFELTTGSMFLVQAHDEDQARRWRESLAAIAEQKKEQSKPVAIQVPEVAINCNDAGNQTKNGQDMSTTVAPVQVGAKVDVSTNNNSSNKDATIVDVTNKVQEVTASRKSDEDKMQAPAPPVQRQHHRHHHYPPSSQRGAGLNQKTPLTDPVRSRLYNRPRIVIKLDPMRVPDHWIEGKYLIEPDRQKGYGFEELGSGQFGKVYAAISEWKAEDASKGLWSGIPVAIKEISKTRFDLRQQAKLKNEANILSRLDHPGVIILERVHDLPDKIYIVMEQLEDDMLEMIVSTEEKRLNERVTKFLTYQILEALRYLHAQNIAHCDLKPENVLLVERRSQFPQIKLCDFGFAKIIEDNSFRSSLVGTPAYLAPEVVKGERYNRSVDLWSVGVIVYVSLSGEFPFNEGENIHEQISRANFANYMYPEQPWGNISNKAKSFINSLLNVNCEKRISIRGAINHEFLHDFTLYIDLCDLEVRIGQRYLTCEADYSYWSRFAQANNLQMPRSPIILHSELND